MNPGVQYPHCAPPQSPYAFWIAARLPCSLMPSTVVTSCPSQLAARSVQESIGVPSTSTVQAPQEESSQPRFDPVSIRSSRSTSNSSLVRSMPSSRGLPLTFSSMSSFFMNSFQLSALSYHLVSIVGRDRIGMLLHAQFFNPACTQLIQIGAAIAHAVYPARKPRIIVAFRFRLLVILPEERVIAFVVTLYRRGVRPQRRLHHGVHQKSWNNRAVGVTGDHLRLDNLFRHDNHTLSRTYSFQHDSEITPAMRITVAIGALHMHDRDIWIQRAHRPQRLFAFKGRENLVEEVIALRYIAS